MSGWCAISLQLCCNLERTLETFGEKLAQVDRANAGIPVPEPETLVARWTGSPDSGPIQGDVKRIADSYQAVWEAGDFGAC